MPNINLLVPTCSGPDLAEAFRWIAEQCDLDVSDSFASRRVDSVDCCEWDDVIGRYLADDEDAEETDEDFENDLIDAIDFRRHLTSTGPSSWEDLEESLRYNDDFFRLDTFEDETGEDDSSDDGPLMESIHKPQLSAMAEGHQTRYIIDRNDVLLVWGGKRGWVEIFSCTPVPASKHRSHTWKDTKGRLSQHDKPRLSKRQKQASVTGVLKDYDRLCLMPVLTPQE